MKTKLYCLYLVCLYLITTPTQSYAQVTIGAGLEPLDGALLDLKEKNASYPQKGNPLTLENGTKGLLFSNVSLKAYNQLTPLYGKETSPGVWVDDSSELEKLLATGMVVYNINPAANQLDVGLFVWNGTQWVACKGNDEESGESAEFTFDCSSVVVHGDYFKGKALDQTNYISVNIFTTKAGSYEVETTTANPANPIKFEGSGNLKEGTQTIFLNGSGTPPESGMFSFNIRIKGSSGSATCSVQIGVAGRASRGIKIIYFGEYKTGDSRSMFIPDRAAYQILMNKDIFGGPGSMCPVKGMEFITGGIERNFRTVGSMDHCTKGADPADIIIIGYDFRPNNAMVDLLTQYAQNN